MIFERVREKLNILADAAKYDVSCASSGSDRKNSNGGLGNATPFCCLLKAAGICYCEKCLQLFNPHRLNPVMLIG